MLIGLLHDRLDKRLARSSSKFEESDSIVTQAHGDVSRARPSKLQVRNARKKTPRVPGAFSRSANTG
jgi:hypothetical protein